MSVSVDDLVRLVQSAGSEMTRFDWLSMAACHRTYRRAGLVGVLAAARTDPLGDGETPASVLAGLAARDADGATTVARCHRAVDGVGSADAAEVVRRVARAVGRVFPPDPSRGHYALLAAHVYAAGLLLRERGADDR
jgi:hypothetical protein